MEEDAVLHLGTSFAFIVYYFGLSTTGVQFGPNNATKELTAFQHHFPSTRVELSTQ